jgi:hypothetical protein
MSEAAADAVRVTRFVCERVGQKYSPAQNVKNSNVEEMSRLICATFVTFIKQPKEKDRAM